LARDARFDLRPLVLLPAAMVLTGDLSLLPMLALWAALCAAQWIILSVGKDVPEKPKKSAGRAVCGRRGC
jgi:hypothetical protein